MKERKGKISHQDITRITVMQLQVTVDDEDLKKSEEDLLDVPSYGEPLGEAIL